MSYDKTAWGGTTLITPARLRKLETQHEKLLVDARVANEPLLAEIASSAPTGETAMIYVNSTDNKLYGYNGTSWIMLGVS